MNNNLEACITEFEDCSGSILGDSADADALQEAILFDPYPARDYHILAWTSFANVALPLTYYLISKDYTAATNQDSQTGSIKWSPRRGRGVYDDLTWKGVSLVHSVLWGISFMFYVRTLVSSDNNY